MTTLFWGKYPDIREDVAEIYDRYKGSIGPGINMMLPPPGGEKKYYIYEWFTNKDNKIFYVGKGTGYRYRHIISDMKRPRGAKYKELQQNFGIGSRFVADGLTDFEASLYEICLIHQRVEEGEVLLQSANNPGQDVYWEQRHNIATQCIARVFSPSIIVDPYHKRYFGITPPPYDTVCIDKLSRVSLFATFSADSPKTVQEMEQLKNNLVFHGGKVFSTIAKSAKAVVEFDNMDYSRYIHLHEMGVSVYHSFDVVKFLDSANKDSKM